MLYEQNSAKRRVLGRRPLQHLSGAGLLLVLAASSCQVDRGGFRFDDDAFSNLGGESGDGDGDMGGQGDAPR